jgi:elongation factor 3
MANDELFTMINNDELFTIDILESMIPILNDAHKKTLVGPRIEQLEKLLTISNFQEIEPYLVHNILPIILSRMDDKPNVAEVALKVGEFFISKLSIQAFPLVASVLFHELRDVSKWKSKIGSLTLLGQYITLLDMYDKDLLSASLPELVNTLTYLLYDTKNEVAELAEIVLRKAMKGITNRDLEPFVEELIKAMKNRNQTEETIQKLGGVVFVQTVEGSALSVVIPLMIAGFRQPKEMIKRMCARIVSNMSKLVEEPLEARPFLKDLIPALEYTIDTIADPEARNVANKTHIELVQLNKKALQMNLDKAFRHPGIISKKLSEKFKKDNNLIIKYISEIVASLIKTKTIDKMEYESETLPYLKLIGLDMEASDFLYSEAQKVISFIGDNIDEDDVELLCDCEFTLAYGTKILLHNTKLKLKKGFKYGLLGKNDCGKTTLMRSIAEGSVDGFPDPEDVRTVFVEADIQGELSHLNCVDYVLEFDKIKKMGITKEMVREVLIQVGFTEGKSAGAGGDCDDPISSLSGGWRMKLALARAMLQKADILLMDEPTNHLDVKNVKWVMNYINSLTNTTVIMVSHDSGLLDNCCNYILQIDSLKLKLHKGNLTEFVKTHPEAKSYFEFSAVKFKFKFPQPCFLDGIKSRGKFLIKMDDVSLTYPGNNAPTINDITIRASMASRVACVGINGAGKSTMIKVLTGELEPTRGTVWKYPNLRIGYIAQHAFHHIENHLTKTANEYIRWRFAFGDDREGLDKATMKLSDEDVVSLSAPIEYNFKTESGQIKKEQRIIERCTGQRRNIEGRKKEYEYEVKWKNKGFEFNSWISSYELTKYNKIYDKVIRMIDQKISNKNNLASRPLTNENVEQHLGDIGLESEYATHYRIGALSGGQKVKVVLAAAMWDQPHILILDEPTNYLDRDSLGALANAIESYEGGVIMITHNDAFCKQLCPERWVLEKGLLNTEGDIEWMDKISKQEVGFKQVEEMVDATGNEVTIKRTKKLTTKDKKKLIKQIKQKIADGHDLESEEEEYAIEWNL